MADRINYLIEWRKGLWEQIRQKENSIWQFISFYAAGVVVLFGLIKVSDTTEDLEFTTTTILVIALVNLFVTVWGQTIVLDANFWLSRNLIFIGNIEREVLNIGDFGTLLPKYYSELPKYRYEKSYSTHIVILTIANLTTLLLVASKVFSTQALTDSEIILASLYSVVFSFGLFSIYFKDRALVKEFYTVRRDAPGKGKRKPQGDLANQVGSTISESPISVWLSFSATLGSGILLLLGYKNQVWFYNNNDVILTVFTLIVPIAALFMLGYAGLVRLLKQFDTKGKALPNLFSQISKVYWWIPRIGLVVTILIWIGIGFDKLF